MSLVISVGVIKFHVYRGGSEDDFEINDFDFSGGGHTKLQISRNNWNQLTLWNLRDEPEEGVVDSLRVMPIPLLYGGFVKIEVEKQSGVWMRTFGNHLLGLPNLAIHAKGHQQGNECFDLFTNVLLYARHAKVEFSAGAEVQIRPDLVYRFRERTDAEWWLESEGTILVLDRIA